jgi:hypothetical protein
MPKKQPVYVVCLKCDYVSFAVSRRKAMAEVKRFNKYFDSLTKKEQKDYYGGKRSDLSLYTCQVCSGTEFRKAKKSEIPFGSTINPVVWECRKPR